MLQSPARRESFFHFTDPRRSSTCRPRTPKRPARILEAQPARRVLAARRRRPGRGAGAGPGRAQLRDAGDGGRAADAGPDGLAPPTWSAPSCSTSTSRSTPSTPSGTWCRCWPRRMPKISADGKTYAITLRKGVKLHNGRELNADDVVASLQRWMEQSRRAASRWRQGGRQPQGQGPAGRRDQCSRTPYAPLLAQLAMASAAWPPSWPRSRSRSR